MHTVVFRSAFPRVAHTLATSRFSSDRAASSLSLAAGCHSFPCSSMNRTSFRLAVIFYLFFVIRFGGKIRVNVSPFAEESDSVRDRVSPWVTQPLFLGALRGR